MKIKADKLREYLKQKGMSKQEFIKKLRIPKEEADKLLIGEAVTETTARRFIHSIDLKSVQEIIDWQAMGVENPLKGATA